MQFQLKNEKVRVVVDSMGAEMHSIQDAGGLEYLWRGQEYWFKHSPNLFPFIGRLTDGSYKYKGKVYPLTLHGFAGSREFAVVSQSETQLTLELRSDDLSRENYPFDFSFQVAYALEEDKIAVTFRIENLGQVYLPFGVGGHPGFNVPLVEGEAFDDYELEFSVPCRPDRVGMTPAVYMNGHDTPYPLRDARFIDLNHRLFDIDTTVLKNMAREVTLRSRVSGKGVTVSYPDCPYLGLWHWPQSDAPYLCIEPWSSLPSRDGVVEEFTCKTDLVQLAPGKVYENNWSIRIF
jgi:galactose mutarotase-like enzyme